MQAILRVVPVAAVALMALAIFAIGGRKAIAPQIPCNETYEARLQPGCDDLHYSNPPGHGLWD